MRYTNYLNYGIIFIANKRSDPLSNAYPCKFTKGGETFYSAEQYYQYQKALFFNDSHISCQILKNKYAYKCSLLGRRIRGFNKSQWRKCHARRHMYDAEIAKYTSCDKMRICLIATGKKYICQPSDPFWGVGLWATHPHLLDIHKWCGQNVFGKILMRVRSKIIKNSPKI